MLHVLSLRYNLLMLDTACSLVMLIRQRGGEGYMALNRPISVLSCHIRSGSGVPEMQPSRSIQGSGSRAQINSWLVVFEETHGHGRTVDWVSDGKGGFWEAAPRRELENKHS
jgi:hypothetical protein